VIHRWVYAIITASFGLGLALLGVESGLQIKERIFDSQKEVPGSWRKANALQSSGIDVYPLLVPSMFILDCYDHRVVAGDPVADRLDGLTLNGVLTPRRRVFPLAGLPLKLNVSVKEGGAWPFFMTDEFGFNNPIGQHVPNTIDVALVGDSMVHGTTVEPSENLAGWLRRSGYKVLNLGQGGSGPLIELGILGEYALPLRPKRVVWLFYEGNDFINLVNELGVDLLVRYLDESAHQRLRERQDEITPSLLAAYREMNDRFKTLKDPDSLLVSMTRMRKIRALLRSRLRTPVEVPIPRIPDDQVAMLARILKIARERTEAVGVSFHVVYLPDVNRFFSEKIAHVQEDNAQAVRSVLMGLKIEVLDFNECLATVQDPQSLFPGRQRGVHYSAKGYRLMAECIETHILGTRFAPRTPIHGSGNASDRADRDPRSR
jgi:lysophospholipase L1-like esterase